MTTTNENIELEKKELPNKEARGTNRERILSFYNTLIPNMNNVLKTNIPLLKNYSIS